VTGRRRALLSTFSFFLTSRFPRSRGLREWNETCSDANGVKGRMAKTRRSSAIAINTQPERRAAGSLAPRVNSSQSDLLARLDKAHKTIKILEQRVAMQEKTYMAAMQEKNRKIRDLQMRLQDR
jgi:hypothetical protein